MLPGGSSLGGGRARSTDSVHYYKKKVMTWLLNARLAAGNWVVLAVLLVLGVLILLFALDRLASYAAHKYVAVEGLPQLEAEKARLSKELQSDLKYQLQLKEGVYKLQERLKKAKAKLESQRQVIVKDLTLIAEQQETLSVLAAKELHAQEYLMAVNAQLKEDIEALEKEDKRIKAMQRSNTPTYTQHQPQPIEATPLPPAVPVNYSVPPHEQQAAVKQAIKFAWDSYKKYAWGQDELRPISKSSQNWVGMGLTIVDSLDTLWIAGLKDEFNDARDWVEKNLHFDTYNRAVSVFETTIRVLGGLLSAYELSNDEMFLNKSLQLADRLLLAFGNNKLPSGSLNFATGATEPTAWAGGSYILSEIGTIQLEYLYLAVKANRPELCAKALDVFNVLDKMPKADNLYYLYVRPDGRWGNQMVSLGALGDSFYEYLMKIWVMTGKKVQGYRRMYDQAMQPVKKQMIKRSKPSDLYYIAELRNGVAYPKMDHLACFAGGMFALGANGNQEDFTIGAGITETCHEIYKRQASGIGPEFVQFQDGSDFQTLQGSTHYLLRPETMESYFVLWRLTHDQKYRDWGWEAFLAMERVCKTENGYSGIRDVRMGTSAYYDDMQQTFFIAETLKYLYLLFSDDDVIPLDKYVFNTEAHPLGILDIDFPEEIAKYFPPDEYTPPDLAVIQRQEQANQLSQSIESIRATLNQLQTQKESATNQKLAYEKRIAELRARQLGTDNPDPNVDIQIAQYLTQLDSVNQQISTLETQFAQQEQRLKGAETQLEGRPQTIERPLEGRILERQNLVEKSLPPPPPDDPQRKAKRELFERHQALLKRQQDLLKQITNLQKEEQTPEIQKQITELQATLMELSEQLHSVSLEMLAK